MSNQFKDIFAPVVIGFYKDNDIRIIDFKEKELIVESCIKFENYFSFKLAIFNLHKYEYEEFLINNCKINECNIYENYYIYRITLGTCNSDYITLINNLNNAIKVVRNKSNGKNEQLLNEVQALDNLKSKEQFFSSFEEQKKEWFKIDISDKENKKIENIIENVELAFEVNGYNLYNELNEKGCKQTIYNKLNDFGVYGKGVFQKEFTRIYIGNEFCLNKLPKKDKFIDLINDINSEGFNITIALPYVKEYALNSIEQFIYDVNEWVIKNGRNIEVVVNDFGIIKLIHEKKLNIIPILGRLLNKHYKDPRYNLKWGMKKNINNMQENYLNIDFFQTFLEKLGIKRYEYESCGRKIKIPNGKHSLHFPYYQTNTSEFCPLNAQCTKFNKNAQKLIESCPQYCDEFYNAYPKNLKLIGRGNSNFGFDNSILTCYDIINFYINNGIDRLVFSI